MANLGGSLAHLTILLIVIGFIGFSTCAKTQRECDLMQTGAKLILEGDNCLSQRGSLCLPENTDIQKFACQSRVQCVMLEDPEKACTAENIKESKLKGDLNVLGEVLSFGTNKQPKDGDELLGQLGKSVNDMLCVCKGAKVSEMSIGLLVITVVGALLNYY